jgi:hypothetical protein
MRTAKLLGPGDYFGEISLMYRSKRTATVCAATFSDLSKLTSTDFEEILKNNPGFAVVIEKNFEQYLKPTGLQAPRRLSAAGRVLAGAVNVSSNAAALVAAKRPSLVSHLSAHSDAQGTSLSSAATLSSVGSASTGKPPMITPLPLASIHSDAANERYDRQTKRTNSGFMRRLLEIDQQGFKTARTPPELGRSALVPLFCAKMVEARRRRLSAGCTGSFESTTSEEVLGDRAKQQEIANEVLGILTGRERRTSRVGSSDCNGMVNTARRRVSIPFSDKPRDVSDELPATAPDVPTAETTVQPFRSFARLSSNFGEAATARAQGNAGCVPVYSSS